MERLSEERIKAGLLHEDLLVRSEALRYFAEEYTRDASVMETAIEAIRRYGRLEAFQFLTPLADLAQSEATVRWAIEELASAPSEEEDQEYYFDRVGAVLSEADPRLVLPYREQIQAGLGEESVGYLFAETIAKRLDLLSWDGEAMWRELDAIHEEVGEFDDPDETREWEAVEIVEALARDIDTHAARMMEILQIDEPQDERLAWLQPLMINMAGTARYQAAAPHLVRLMASESEFYSENCLIALARIGTDACVQALHDAYREGETYFRMFAIGALSQIHRDQTTPVLLEWLEFEKDWDLRDRILEALPGQFTRRGNDVVRDNILKEVETDTLWERLDASCALMGIEYPELQSIRAENQASKEREAAEYEALRQRQADRYSKVVAEEREALAPAVPPERPFTRDEKVGRNDPCPCGSGKKFKKCCMK